MTKAQAEASKENKPAAKRRATTLWVKSFFLQAGDFIKGYCPNKINKR